MKYYRESYEQFRLYKDLEFTRYYDHGLCIFEIRIVFKIDYI